MPINPIPQPVDVIINPSGEPPKIKDFIINAPLIVQSTNVKNKLDSLDSTSENLSQRVAVLETRPIATASGPSGDYVPTSRTINSHALTADITITKSDLGLANVDNTSDINKPVSTAQAAADAAVLVAANAYTDSHSGGLHGNGTLASLPISPSAGDTYAVTSGVAMGDRYVCYVAGAWTIVAYSRVRLDETPYHWWKLNDASGGAVDYGTFGTGSNLSEEGFMSFQSIVYKALLPIGDSIRFSLLSGTKRLQSAINTGVALTTAATLAAWIRADGTGGIQEIVALETNLGYNNPPYFSLALHVSNGALRVYITTTASPGSGQSVAVNGIVAGCLHHVGLTFESSNLVAWIDGVAVGSMASTGSTIFTAGSAEYWTISDAVGPGERFAGRIADVRVYQTAKDASWWQETYKRGVGSYVGQ